MPAPRHGAPTGNGPSWGTKGTAAAVFAAGLAFEHVSKSFGETDAVRDVSFHLSAGEIVCLLGPSGCGKTTVLRLAAGVETPTSGRILLSNEEVAGPNQFVPPEKRGVGLVFQDFALFPHLSNLENVAFGLKSLGAAAARNEALNALRRVGLLEFADGRPWALSGGEQQRVALARAIVPRPALILMDEPFSGLDQRLREDVRRQTLAVLKETRATALIVTHDPHEAMELADRILLMRRGRLAQTGTPRELYDQPGDADTARFFSDVNELRGVAEKGFVRTPWGAIPAKGMAEAAKVQVLIRPQGLKPQTGRQNGSIGHVLDVRFLGDELQLLVLFDELEEPLVARVPAGMDISPGAALGFTFDLAHVFVFAS